MQMARGNWLHVERDVAALVAANPHESECVCRCKILTEVMGLGWPDAVQARVDALSDPRASKAAARVVSAPTSFLSLVRSMGGVRIDA
jgi:hypothetical protein